MKKSFLITLAAVSSVALIGCSSDDSKGGNGESATAEKTTVAPLAVTTGGSFYGIKVLPLTNSQGAALNMEVSCTTEGNDTKVKKDEDKNILVIASTDEATVAKDCKVKLTGVGVDTKAEPVVLDFSKASHEIAAQVTVKDGSKEIGSITLTQGDAVKEYTVEAAAAGKLEFKDGVATYTPGAKFETYKLVEKSLTDVYNSTANTSFSIDATKAKAKVTGSVEVQNTASGDAVLYTVPVEIKEKKGDGTTTPPPPAPALALDTLKVIPHLNDTTYVKLPVVVANEEITKLTCQLDGQDCSVEVDFDGTAKNSFFVKAAKLKDLQTSVLTISAEVKSGKKVESLAINKDLVEQYKPMLLVADVASIKEISCTDGSDVEPQPNFGAAIELGATDEKCYQVTTQQVSKYADKSSDTGHSVDNVKLNEAKLADESTIANQDAGWDITGIAAIKDFKKCSEIKSGEVDKYNVCVTKIKGNTDTGEKIFSIKTKATPHNSSAKNLATFKGKAGA